MNDYISRMKPGMGYMAYLHGWLFLNVYNAG
jgi:hypothetical protein